MGTRAFWSTLVLFMLPRAWLVSVEFWEWGWGKSLWFQTYVSEKKKSGIENSNTFFFLNDVGFSLDSEVKPLRLEGLQSCL